MKKSTLSKIVLALVLVALVCSIFACTPKDNGSTKKSGSTDPLALDPPTLTVNGGTVTWTKVKGAASYDYVIYGPGEGEEKEGNTKALTITIAEGQSIKVRSVTSDPKSFATGEYSAIAYYEATIQDRLVSLVEGIQGVTDVLTSVSNSATDKICADLSIGGYVKSASSDLDNSLALEAKANASKNDPEFIINFKLNKTDYISLGYKDGKILIREPINFVNTDEETPNAFFVDVTALEPSIQALVGAAFDKLISVKGKIDLSSITSTVRGIMQGLGSTLDLSELITLDDGKTEVSLGIKIGLLDTGISMLPNLLKEVDVGAMVDQYIGYANKVLTAIGLDELSINDKPLSWATITGAISAASKAVDAAKAIKGADLSAIKEDLIAIKVTYADEAKKNMNGLSLVADLSVLRIAGIDYEAGLTIGLPTFRKGGSDVVIDTSAFTAQDLVIDLNGALGVKGIDADVKGVVRLSDGLKTKTNKWATVVATANDKTSVGYIDATGAYVDFSGIYELFNIADPAIPAYFSYEFDENIVDSLNDAVVGFFSPAASNAAPEDYEFDLNEIINGFSAASDKVDFVCGYIYNNFVPMIDGSVKAKANAGQADLISWAFNFKLGDTNTAAKDYVLFYNNATSFEGLWTNIKACHNNGKAALDAATFASGKKAGIQLTAEGDDNDLLDYLAYFVMIPTIDGEDVDFENRAAVNDKDALKAWLNWIFPRGNKYRDMVDGILGIRLDEIIDNGLYLEAIGGTGLAGSVRAASKAEGEDVIEYVELGAGIDIAAATATPAVTGIELPENVEFTDFTATNADEEYLIKLAAIAMRDGLTNY